MAFRFKRGENVADGTRRIVIEQIDRARDELVNAELDRSERIHQARKRFKKIRAVLRLVRDTVGDRYGEENAWYRDAGRELAAARDAAVLVETVDALREAYVGELRSDAFARVRSALGRRSERIARESLGADAGDGPIEELRRSLLDARGRVTGWAFDGDGWEALGPGFRETYRRGRRAMRKAESQPTDIAYHEWRKRVKYHWYHVRLARGAWPRLMNARRKALSDLSSLLGLDHDLAVLAELLTCDDKSLGPKRERGMLVALARRRQAALRAEGHALAARLYAAKPGELTHSIGQYWAAWRNPTSPPGSV